MFKQLKTGAYRWLYAKLFDLYIALMVRDIRTGSYEKGSHVVCDYLGPIDTLGSEWSHGNRTSSYSDELHSEFVIHAPLYDIVLVNVSSSENSITIKRRTRHGRTHTTPE